jgi:NADPH-dependent curcumin reductase
VQDSDFELRTTPLYAPEAGQALGRTRWLSFEPAMRGWLDDDPNRWGRTEGVPAAGYALQVAVGDAVFGPAVVEVIESRHAELEVGDLVRGLFGWREHVTLGAESPYVKLDPSVPIPAALSVLGGNGLTAYFGLLDVGRAQEGETVVVSAAAGAVGSVAAQIARVKGCRVIGIAGGEEKCRWLREECGLDECIDYKNETPADRLRQLCPDAIDVFFDNVGGAVLQAAMANMAVHGRIVLCGAVAGYDGAGGEVAPCDLFHLVARRIRMEGFLLADFATRFDEGERALRAWFDAGLIAYRADVQHGFENVPQTFRRLFSGANRGKQLLEL